MAGASGSTAWEKLWRPVDSVRGALSHKDCYKNRVSHTCMSGYQRWLSLDRLRKLALLRIQVTLSEDGRGLDGATDGVLSVLAGLPWG